MEQKTNNTSIFSLILLSVGTMVGSGWLFACYYAAKEAGPLSILSWVIGACVMSLMALLLCELTIKFPKKNGLFTNLVSLSHNPHIGFILSSCSWFLGLVVLASEAIATTQYLSGLSIPFFHNFFIHDQLTLSGMLISVLFMLFYAALNFWGIQLLAKANNVITLVKIGIPIIVVAIFIYAAFPMHASNYSLHTHMDGISKTSSMFGTIINSGIFYSFFGFQAAASFASELRNPEKSVPIALIGSIVIVLLVYVSLQIVFIGVLPPHVLNNGWSGLDMQSPLAQLAILLGLNFFSILVYIESAISPSGTGLVYFGVTSRIFNEMVKDGQMPARFGGPRIALAVTFVLSSLLIFFFTNWQMIASLMTTFIVLACLGLPVGHARLQAQEKNFFPKRFIPFPKFFTLFLFLGLSYLFLISEMKNLIVAAVLQFVLYFIYVITKSGRRSNFSAGQIVRSAWSMLFYLLIIPAFAIAQRYIGGTAVFYTVFFIAMAGSYYLIVNQKDYCQSPAWTGAEEAEAQA